MDQAPHPALGALDPAVRAGRDDRDRHRRRIQYAKPPRRRDQQHPGRRGPRVGAVRGARRAGDDQRIFLRDDQGHAGRDPQAPAGPGGQGRRVGNDRAGRRRAGHLRLLPGGRRVRPRRRAAPRAQPARRAAGGRAVRRLPLPGRADGAGPRRDHPARRARHHRPGRPGVRRAAGRARGHPGRAVPPRAHLRQLARRHQTGPGFQRLPVGRPGHRRCLRRRPARRRRLAPHPPRRLSP